MVILIFIKMQRQGDNIYFLFNRTHIEFDHIYRKFKIYVSKKKKNKKICPSTDKVLLVP